jgi:NAD(P)-dependent dehydrogenase (short-subunit alcohol dehydrogenase family)
MSKVALVIGASRGIGKELALLLAQKSEVKVIALSRKTTDMEAFCVKADIDFHFFDLASKTIHSDLAEILKDTPRIDYVINNAGKLVNKPFLELTKEDLNDCYQVNVIGVMEAMQVVIPKMLEQGGHIVNISTMGAFQGTVKFPGLTAYSTSKAALTSFTELFAEEYKETKIKMNCLCLGAAQTEMLEEAFPGYKAPLTAQQMATYIADFTLNAHKYMNGKIIPVSLTTP